MNSALSGSYSQPIGGASSALGGGGLPGQTGTGGILSNVSLSLGSGGKIKLKDITIEYQDFAEVGERQKNEVAAMVFRYAQLHYSDGQEGLALVTTGLDNALGVKYARLSRDWVRQQRQIPDMSECNRFVSLIVEAAAVDGGREPFSWKIQRAISNLLDRLFKGQNEQAQIPHQTQVGAVVTET